MESISDTKWDVVISGTGLQSSLLALALSRSGKNILHVDPNEYYGGSEAAFSLPEIDEWAKKHSATDAGQLFSAAEVIQDGQGLASPRRYNIALAPQLIHARSKLLSQLVGSKAFRQVEFLAVGSFYIYQSTAEGVPSLSRIPSTREDVFLNKSIPARSKRTLMKFLKFVLDFDSEENTQTWQSHAVEPLLGFLASEFKLDSELQSYIVTLTLSRDGNISVKDGLTIINKHLTSMGAFGPGFAAVYPKWGGLCDVAQVGCRASAVGGAVYMLGTGIKELPTQCDEELSILLSNDEKVNTRLLVQEPNGAGAKDSGISRLVAITPANFSKLFEVLIEGAPIPAVTVVAFPSGGITLDGAASQYPIYAMVHSSETGECPPGQYIMYLSTVCNSSSKALLKQAMTVLLASVGSDAESSTCPYQLYYEQREGVATLGIDGKVASFPAPSLELAFDDSILDPVHETWKLVVDKDAEGAGVEYMNFEDREPVDDFEE